MILYILTIIGSVSCCHQTSPEVSLKIKQDSDGFTKIEFLQIDISNNSSENIYLTNFILTNYLKIYNSKGVDFTLTFLENESFEDTEKLYKKMSNNNNANPSYIQFKDTAIKSDYKRIKRLNFFLKIDSVKRNSLDRAIGNKYENILLIESGETITIYHSINSLKKSNDKFKIIFKYPDEHMPLLSPGLMRCYQKFDGKDDKFFTLFITRGLNEINGYKLFKRNIMSDPIFVN